MGCVCGQDRCRAKRARAVYAALGIGKREIDAGQPWQNYIEPMFGVMRRLVEYASDTLAQYPVTLEADGHRLREVGEPRLYAAAHASPQPFLRPFDAVAWHPATRLAPYRRRRQRASDEHQEQLFEVGNEAPG